MLGGAYWIIIPAELHLSTCLPGSSIALLLQLPPMSCACFFGGRIKSQRSLTLPSAARVLDYSKIYQSFTFFFFCPDTSSKSLLMLAGLPKYTRWAISFRSTLNSFQLKHIDRESYY